MLYASSVIMSCDEDYKSLLLSCLERYEKARKLMEPEKMKDFENDPPPSEPYKLKYAAKEILSEIKNELVKSEDEIISRQENASHSPIVGRISAIIAAIHYHLGVISVETEELSTGEELLHKCVELLKEREMNRECVLIYMLALNQLGILWAMRGQHRKAADFLEKVEHLCRKYRAEVGLAPYEISDLFYWSQDEAERSTADIESNWKYFEKVLTHTYYYLAQVFSGLEETVRAAMYCHTTLRRQLESKEFDPLDWAVNCATLSQFFISQNNFADARHHLACALYILDNYEVELCSQESKNDDYEDLMETVRRRRADIARCWAKYGLLLLTFSWDEQVRQVVSEIVDGVDQTHIAETKSDQKSETVDNACDEPEDWNCVNVDMFQSSASSGFEKPRMIFKSLEVTAIEEQITCKTVSDFEHARPVFLNAQKWLNLSKEYYSLSDHATDHIQIVQDISKLYKVLAFYESSESRKCKMHKRRIDLLEGVLKELNPQYYMNEVRQLNFELAETYSEIMDSKLTISNESRACRPAHIVNKINHLALQSIKYFQAFIDTFMNMDRKLPEEFPDEVVRPVLLAHFCIGRLHSKLITFEPRQQVDNLRRSLASYKFVVDYCDNHPASRDVVKEELLVTQEIVQLLPAKIEKIASGMSL